ncbi:MAG: hypothetical protein JWN25_1307 [Verrucomicrobiales bacterium]|nr:hypothetical protein [Verrucomicrobiales bacterium]
MKTKSCILLTLLVALFGFLNPLSAEIVLDPTFNAGTGTDAFVESCLVQPDGKVLICGGFTNFNGVARNYIARLNANGTLDTTFNAFPSYWVRHMALQPNGKIMIGGFFKSVGGQSRNLIARLNADGSLDTTFNPGAGAIGTLGTSITGNPDPFIFQLALQPDGKVVFTGNFTNYNGVTINGIARVNANGSLDTTFNVGSGLNTWGRSIQVLPNNQILVTGWFDNYNNSSHDRMVLINPNGSPDSSFHPFFGDRTSVYTAIKLPNGQYIAAGHSLNFDNLFTEEIRRLNADGSVDTSFQGRANEKIQSVRLQANGKILIAGEFSQVDGVNRQRLALLNPDGTLDDSVNESIDNFLWMVIPLAGDRILVSGGFNNINNRHISGVARFVPAASLPKPQIHLNGLATWYMNGAEMTGSGLVNNGLPIAAGWRYVGMREFNGDGQSDILWQGPSGQLAVWTMNGVDFSSGSVLQKIPVAGHRATGLADLNGDGQTDILFRWPDGRISVWLMNGGTFVSEVMLNGGVTIGTNWQIVGARDFNGDNKDDLVLQSTAGQVAIWSMDGTVKTGAVLLNDGKTVGAGWRLAGVGDLNGAGSNDLIFQHPSGYVIAWFMEGTTIANRVTLIGGKPIAAGWHIVGLNDFNKDGHADIVWQYTGF